MISIGRRIIQSNVAPSALCRLASSFQAPLVDKTIEKESFNDPQEKSLIFNNAQAVFGHRTTKELMRAYLVLHACAIEPLVIRSYKLMRLGERLLGKFLLSKLMSPFYFQFVAGDSEQQYKNVASVLSSLGINVMVAGMLETDIGEADGRANLFQTNFHRTLELVHLGSQCKTKAEQKKPVVQTKITAHINADSLTRISAAYETLNRQERSELVQAIGNRMKKLRRSEPLSTMELLSYPGLIVCKEDIKAMEDSLPRLVKIGEECKDKNVILAVDAEYTYTNNAISLLTLALMMVFNDGPPIIWNTYQGYLKSSRYWLEFDFETMRSLGVSFGAKIVRGAYMEREREYARMNNQPDPVNDTYAHTNEMYDSLIKYILAHVAKEPTKCQLMVASHNEASVHRAAEGMRRLGIPNSTSAVLFAQIYGMAENITVPLSKAGYTVYKSIPYGTITDVLPYLSRRANENRAVFRGARRERELLSQEIRRRLKGA